MRQLQAFSLLELMTVVGIIAIVAAATIPNYKGHVVRSRISTLMPIIENYKNDVITDIGQGVLYGNTVSTKIASGAANKPKYLTQLDRAAYGCLSAQFDLAQLGLTASGNELTLMLCPSLNVYGNVVWSCGYSATSTVEYGAYLPLDCRQQVVQDTTQ